MNETFRDMPKETREKIRNRIQSNFGLIRKIANLNIDELTDLLEVSRQTIYNIEKGKTPLTYPQMTVILLALEKLSKGNQTLKDVLNTILNLESDDWFDEVHKDINNQSKMKTENVVKAGVIAAVAGATLTRAIGGVALGPLGIIAGAVINSWLTDKVINSIKEKDENKK